MPELPEVETIARDLDVALTGQRIVSVEVRHPGVIAAPSVEEFAERLPGHLVTGVWRRAKYIVVDLAGNPSAGSEPPGGFHLVIHLRMTGRLLLQPADTAPEKHTHVILRFQAADLPGFPNPGRSAEQLHFRDTRRFGRLWLLDDAGLRDLFAKLGPEPLQEDFTPQQLAVALKGRTTKLKPFLLDQSRLAGLGNIYADEALFQAGLHPERAAKSLSAAETERLCEAIRRVLSDGVTHRGTSLSDAEYRDAQGEMGEHQGHVAVFRRQGRPCPRCGAPVERMRLAGRSTHYCPTCQPPAGLPDLAGPVASAETPTTFTISATC